MNSNAGLNKASVFTAKAENTSEVQMVLRVVSRHEKGKVVFDVYEINGETERPWRIGLSVAGVTEIFTDLAKI